MYNTRKPAAALGGSQRASERVEKKSDRSRGSSRRAYGECGRGIGWHFTVTRRYVVLVVVRPSAVTASADVELCDWGRAPEKRRLIRRHALV